MRACVSVCIKSSLHSVRFLQLLHRALKCTSKGGTCKLNQYNSVKEYRLFNIHVYFCEPRNSTRLTCLRLIVLVTS